MNLHSSKKADKMKNIIKVLYPQSKEEIEGKCIRNHTIIAYYDRDHKKIYVTALDEAPDAKSEIKKFLTSGFLIGIEDALGSRDEAIKAINNVFREITTFYDSAVALRALTSWEISSIGHFDVNGKTRAMYKPVAKYTSNQKEVNGVPKYTLFIYNPARYNDEKKLGFSAFEVDNRIDMRTFLEDTFANGSFCGDVIYYTNGDDTYYGFNRDQNGNITDWKEGLTFSQQTYSIPPVAKISHDLDSTRINF